MTVRWRVAAVEALPRPKAAVGVVFVDVATRTLTVRLSELESSFAQRLWTEGWERLRRDQEAGWPANSAWVWCDVPGARQVVHGEPVDGGALAFRFPPGAAGYTQLVSRPGLTAILTMDTSSRLILGVSFRNRAGA